MYDNLFNDMKSKMQPILSVAEINRKAFEKLAALQTECITDCVNASLKQLKTLGSEKNAEKITASQFEFIRSVEGKLSSAAEQNLATISEAKGEISKLIGSSYTSLLEANPFQELKDAVEKNRLMAPVLQLAPKAAAPVEKNVKAPAPSKPAAVVEQPKAAATVDAKPDVNVAPEVKPVAAAPEVKPVAVAAAAKPAVDAPVKAEASEPKTAAPIAELKPSTPAKKAPVRRRNSAPRKNR